MKASQLAQIEGFPTILNIVGKDDREFGKITSDSREAGQGVCFAALRGSKYDGHQFIPDAVAKGTDVILCEELPVNVDENVCYIKLNNARKALGVIAHELVGRPGKEMLIVGVTGTNGKTTVATLLYQLFSSAEHIVGLISTIENRIGSKVVESTHTTPDPVRMANLFKDMKEAGCTHIFMEVSSHAIDQERIAGIPFTVAGFTNITHDHLDYHGTFLNYIRSKKKFFDDLSPDSFAIINMDDRNGKIMVEGTKAKVRSYAMRSQADFKCRILQNGIDGLHLKINDREAFMLLSGSFNAYNLTCVYGIATLLGMEEEDCLRRLSILQGAEGRMEKVKVTNSDVTGIVDYAHTPDALENVLKTLNDLRTKEMQIITVLGCGGDRDKTKRPLMGKIAARLSDKVVLTSDNPRSEDASTIISEMKDGIGKEDLPKVVDVIDRREAIKIATLLARGRDIVLVAGKGHEKYQEIKGVKTPFYDKKVLESVMGGGA